MIIRFIHVQMHEVMFDVIVDSFLFMMSGSLWMMEGPHSVGLFWMILMLHICLG